MRKLQLYLSCKDTSGTVYSDDEEADPCSEKKEIMVTVEESFHYCKSHEFMGKSVLSSEPI